MSGLVRHGSCQKVSGKDLTPYRASLGLATCQGLAVRLPGNHQRMYLSSSLIQRFPRGLSTNYCDFLVSGVYIANSGKANHNVTTSNKRIELPPEERGFHFLSFLSIFGDFSCQPEMASEYGTVAHLLPQNYKRMVSEWLEEDCPSFDCGGFVVGEAPAEARLLGKSTVGLSVLSLGKFLSPLHLLALLDLFYSA